jgi:polyhydroxyalkanoate synthesis regulator phasin
MSDDLVKHLRNSKGWPTLGNAAADRIEELEAKLADRTAWRNYALDVVEAAKERIKALEAKLAKVEGEKETGR